MPLVIDTNILISAIFFGGLPKRLCDMVVAGLITVVVTDAIVAEYKAVIEEMREKYSAKELPNYASELFAAFTHIESATQIAVCRDSDDDKFIAAAIDGGCQYLVSGDGDLLVLGKYANVEIVTVRKFLNRWENVCGHQANTGMLP
jgi:putative PIN family toxin of toxin-antitoxin system